MTLLNLLAGGLAWLALSIVVGFPVAQAIAASNRNPRPRPVGAGMNFSASTEIPNNLSAEVLQFDRRPRTTDGET